MKCISVLFIFVDFKHEYNLLVKYLNFSIMFWFSFTKKNLNMLSLEPFWLYVYIELNQITFINVRDLFDWTG